MQIGEVSKILGLKPETIRYYEKEGLVTPQRKNGGTFREYSMWNFFELCECRRLRLMNFSISETKRLLKADTVDEVIDIQSKKQIELYDEANQKMMLAAEIKSLTERISTAFLNIGNYWFSAEEEKFCIHITQRSGQQYTDIDTNDPYLKSWIDNHPFINIGMRVPIENIQKQQEQNEMFFCASPLHFKLLHLPEQKVFCIPGQVYLHTVLDIGGYGDLTLKMLEPVLEYAESRGIEIEDYIIGEYLTRHMEGESLHRYIEIKVPTKIGNAPI